MLEPVRQKIRRLENEINQIAIELQPSLRNEVQN
jgi:hypothetical protein